MGGGYSGAGPAQHGGTASAVKAVLYAVLVVAFGATYVWVHHVASFSFPVPWPDEAVCLWQAAAVTGSNSLVAPEINPERPALCVPPGYPVLTGLLLKITGFSFAFARDLSMGWMIGAFLLLALMAWRHALPFLSLLLCGSVLLGKDWVIAGNVARMEAPVLFAVCLGFALIQRGHDYKGVAVLAVTPLIHPNAACFLAAGAALVVLRNRKPWRRVSGPDAAVLLAAAAAWLAFAVFLATHWQAFWHDVTIQFASQSHATLASTFTQMNSYLILMLLCLLYCWQESLPIFCLLAPALPAWLIFVIRQEQWYQVYTTFSVLLVGIVLLQVARHFTDRLSGSRGKLTCAIPVALAVLALGAWFRGRDSMPNPRGYPANLASSGMHMPQTVAYLEESDVTQVRQYLASLPAMDRPWLVEFYPSADSLFFRDVKGERVAIWQRQSYPGAPDLYIIHESRYLPEWWDDRMAEELQAAQIDPEQGTGLLFQRDGTESWYVGSGGRAPGEAVLP